MLQKLDREVGLRVAAKRLPKSSSWESEIVRGQFKEIGDSIFKTSSVASCYKCNYRTNNESLG